MLQKLREKTSGWIAGVVIGILIIPFAFFGVTDYFSGSAETWVAKVGDSEITQQEFQRRFEEYRTQMRQMLGERYDGALLERPETRTALLNRMVDEELLRQSATLQGAIVPPAVLQDEIAKIPAFQVEGKFSVDQYRLLLAGQNMTPRDFERRILRDLEIRAMPQQIEATAFATPTDVERYLALRDQRRDLHYVIVEAPALGAEALSDDEVNAFYETNLSRYQTDEQVSIEYVQLDAATLEVPAVADEETLQQRYEEASNRFVEPEQRLASHILIKTDADADADAQRTAQAQAQALVDQARSDKADFAGIARASSEDVGSKTAGGDLGWLERGLTDPAFESALFALEPGAISDPVKSADGWHVIQLREVRAEKRKEFAEVRADLEREFLETERERRFSDLSGQMVDAIYRDPTTLQTAAKEIGLVVQKTESFSRLGGADPVTSNPKVIQAAFSPSAISDQHVSDPIELEGNRYLALRVLDHQPAAPIPLVDIRAQVEGELRQDQRAKSAKQNAQMLFDRLQAGEALEALATEIGVEVTEAIDTVRTGVTLDSAISSAAFALQHPADGKSEFTQVSLQADRYALVQLMAVKPGVTTELDATQRTALRDQLAQTFGGSESLAYVAALRKQIEVRLAPDRL